MQYILGLYSCAKLSSKKDAIYSWAKVHRDYKNRKIELCQAHAQVSLQNKGLCACVLKC